MPKITTDHFLVGYIRAKMEQLRSIAHTLDNQNRRYARVEIEELRKEIYAIDCEIQFQSKLVKNPDMGTVILEYQKLSALTTKRLTQRHCGGTSRDDSPQRGKALLPTKTDTTGALGKVKCSKKKKANPSLQFEDITTAAFDDYDSDSSAPLAMELLSKINPAKDFKPIVFNDSLPTEDRPRSKEPRRQADFSNASAASTSRGRERNNQYGKGSQSSRASTTFMSYVSAEQERFKEPKKGITYPPMAWSLPKPLSKKDPSIIGCSEIYINNKDNKGKCMVCQGSHKMYRCTTMLRAGLQERWYLALSKGVCLHCLYPRHSSFTCKEIGACHRCKTRHNSVLCPKNPANQN